MNGDARNPAELAVLIDSSREGWEAGREQLYDGRIPAWLRSTGYGELARLWHDGARTRCGRHRDDGVEAFLHVLDPELAPPSIRVSPGAVDLPGLKTGERSTVSITVENPGRGNLSGSVELIGGGNAVRAGPPRVEANGVLGRKGRVDVEIDTRRALRGRATVRLRTNAGVRDIPVTFSSAFPARLLCPFVAALAAALAGVLLLDRFTRPFDVSLPLAAAGLAAGCLPLRAGRLRELHAYRALRRPLRAAPAVLLALALLLNLGKVCAAAPSMVGDSGGATAVAFDPAQTSIAAGDEGGFVTVWKLPGGEPSGSFSTGYPVRCMAYSPDGRTLAAGGRGPVKLFRPGRDGAPVEIPQGGVRSLAFSPDGSLLACGGRGGEVNLWSAGESWKRVLELRHSEEVLTVAFSSDGGRLVSGDAGVMGLGGLVRTWEVKSGRPLAAFRESYWVSAARFSPDGLDVVTAGGLNRRVTIRTASSGLQVASMEHAGWGKWVRSLEYLEDGSALVAGGGDRICLWDSSRLTPVRLPARPAATRVLVHEGPGRINCIDCSPDCRWVAYGTGDGRVLLRDLAGARPPRVMIGVRHHS